jgi:hypothetical protein
VGALWRKESEGRLKEAIKTKKRSQRWEEGEEEDLRKKEGLKQGCLKKTAQKPNKTKSKEPCRSVFQSKLRRKGSLDKTYTLDPTPLFFSSSSDSSS